MELNTKYRLIDDRYWQDFFKSPCKNCKHFVAFWNHSCSKYPEDLPPIYWNNQKACPNRKPIEK